MRDRRFFTHWVHTDPSAGQWEKVTWSWGFGAGTTHGAEFDVKGGDAEFLGALGDVLGGQHRGVGGGLVTVSLHLHTAGHTHQSFLKELQSS